MKQEKKKQRHSKKCIYPPMTRKQALAVLYQLRKAYIDALPYEVLEQESCKQLQDQSFDALVTLTHAFYGDPAPFQTVILCGWCHCRYGEYSHEGKYRADIWPSCCSSCYERLKAEGRFAHKQEAEVQA